jgi:predicted amidohydrolase YtcJ
MRFSLTGAGVLLGWLGSTAIATAAPDLILYDANIVTVDTKFSTAHAVAITGAKFAAVGSDKDILALAGPGTVKLDLHHQTILPGFNDTHNHQMGHSRGLSVAIDLTDIHSIADIQKQIAAKVKTLKPGEWVQGTRGWWEYELKDGRLPNRFDLDKMSPNNPVTIPGPHYAIVNSMALKLAGITKDTPNPEGGEIRKDPKTGEPTGELFDNAGRAVSSVMPALTADQIKFGIIDSMNVNISNGLTSIGEPSGSVAEYNVYKKMIDDGELKNRIDFAFDIDPEDPVPSFKAQLAKLGPPGHPYGDHMLRADEIGELNLDGAELTALLREEYPARPGYKGMIKVQQDQFNQVILAIDEAGYRPRPHVVGDAAIDEALTAFEYANARKSIVDRRWMIDHAFLLLPDMYDKVIHMGLIVNSEYMHDAQLGKLILEAWHRPLADKMENYKDWLKNGIFMAGGSDGPISYHSVPIYEIYGEVTRGTLWGGKLGADQGITREQAIRSVTINGAYTSFEEHLKGSIEPGKYADFVLLSDDILKIPAEKIKDIKVLATVLGGRAVYGTLH